MFRLRNDFSLTNQLLAFILYVCGAHVCAPMCLCAQVCNYLDGLSKNII